MAIEVVFNTLAIACFVLMFVGIALVVVNASRGQGIQVGVVLAVLGLLLGGGFIVASQGLLIIGPTERGVVFNSLTGELGTPLSPGFHIVTPGVTQTFIYNVGSQEYTMSGENDGIQARSADGQNVFVDVTVLFNIAPENVNTVHQKWSSVANGYIEGLIRPVVRSVVREGVATVSAENIFGSSTVVAEGQPEVSSLEQLQIDIEARVVAELADDGFEVSDVLIRSINFSPEFVNAIESRQVAELERDRASVEAETARIEAAGLADARIERARGDAEAIRIQAEAEAEALRLVSEQIASNPNLIQYTYITELGDNVSLVLIPSNSPFLFDPASFTELGADFSAPQNNNNQEEGTGN